MDSTSNRQSCRRALRPRPVRNARGARLIVAERVFARVEAVAKKEEGRVALVEEPLEAGHSSFALRHGERHDAAQARQMLGSTITVSRRKATAASDFSRRSSRRTSDRDSRRVFRAMSSRSSCRLAGDAARRHASTRGHDVVVTSSTREAGGDLVGDRGEDLERQLRRMICSTRRDRRRTTSRTAGPVLVRGLGRDGGDVHRSALAPRPAVRGPRCAEVTVRNDGRRTSPWPCSSTASGREEKKGGSSRDLPLRAAEQLAGPAAGDDLRRPIREIFSS